MQLPLPAGSVTVDARGHAVLPATLLDGRRPHVARAADQRKRNRSGKIGETTAAALNDVCLHAGIARVVKIATPFRVVGEVAWRGRPALVCVRAKRSITDYQGRMRDGTGRSVSVEAKRVGSGRFPLSRLEDHQREWLSGTHADNGGAVVLVIHGEAGVFALPWTLCGRAIDRGRTANGPESLNKASKSNLSRR